MKAERVQSRFENLDRWVLVKKPSQTIVGKEEPEAIWTAFEMADHLEACELVAEIGVIADKCCASPDLDIRRNIVFVTAGLSDEDFDFAEAVDRDIGNGQRANSLVGR